MANIVPNSFKSDLLKGVFNFDTSGNGGTSFKLALYTTQAGFSAAGTTAYTTTNEVLPSGTSYPTAGKSLTNLGIAGTTTAFVDFDNVTFPNVSLSATGALIYKDGGSNNAVLVLDFGGTKTATNGDFVIQFPTADASNAIIRLGDAP